MKIKQSRAHGTIAVCPTIIRRSSSATTLELLGILLSLSLSLPLRFPLSLSSRGHGGRAARSILQLIYVPIVSVHWVTKYPGTGPRTLTAVVTACNDRRYQQFHRIRPRVVCVCMGAGCGVA